MKTFILAVTAAAVFIGHDVQAQRAKQKMGATPIGDVARYFSSENYPLDALKAERAGRVVADVGVDSAGNVVSCGVKQSSGTISLDTKTCEIIQARVKFQPATDRRGRSIASVYPLSVRWSISDDEDNMIDLGKGLDVAQEVEWAIGPDGLVESCKTLIAGPVGAADACARYPAGRPWGAIYTSDGQPIRAIVRDRATRHVATVAMPK